jgi:hypothetical protein
VNCIKCNAPIEKGSVCESCQKERNRLYRIKRVNNFLSRNECTTCGKQMDREGWVCIKCVTVINKHSQAKVQDRKRNKQCVRCGISSPFSSYCPSCREKNTTYMKNRRQTMRGL